jgi:hypothetical protein
MRRALMAAVIALVPAGAAGKCLLPSEKGMIEAQLFFGRDVEGRGSVSDGEWKGFVEGVIAKEFPDGFTVSDGEGNWRDPKSGQIVRERSKVVLIVAPERGLAGRLRTISESYRSRFHQTAVGVVTREVCAAF